MINGYGFFQLSMCGNGNMLQWYRLQTLIEGAIEVENYFRRRLVAPNHKIQSITAMLYWSYI